MLKKTCGITKYAQLKELLIREIQMNYNSGERFLTEKEIMSRYSVSGATVATAMKNLTIEGWVERRRGGGTFVLNIPQPAKQQTLMPELIINMDKVSYSRLHNPLNYFVSSEIRRGIINSYRGMVKIIDNAEIEKILKQGKNKNLVLVNPGTQIIKLLNGTGNRFVIINQNQRNDYGINTISWQCLPGVYELMKYLIIELGHRRIAFIYGALPQHYDRFAGYQIGLRTFGIDFDERLVVDAREGTETAGYNAMKKLLELNERPTAVFADTDIKAAGAMKAALDMGLKIPEDISVAGFDDIPQLEDLRPGLTTVKVPYYEMGLKAVNMLGKLNPASPETKAETISTKLIIRDSCSVPLSRSQN